MAADIASIQDYWGQRLGSTYRPIDTVLFAQSVQTGCGGATSGSGPFYCPAAELVYIDLSFFDDLQTQFGAEGGTFVNATCWPASTATTCRSCRAPTPG